MGEGRQQGTGALTVADLCKQRYEQARPSLQPNTAVAFGEIIDRYRGHAPMSQRHTTSCGGGSVRRHCASCERGTSTAPTPNSWPAVGATGDPVAGDGAQAPHGSPSGAHPSRAVAAVGQEPGAVRQASQLISGGVDVRTVAGLSPARASASRRCCTGRVRPW